jgi:hypothetical protein
MTGAHATPCAQIWFGLNTSVLVAKPYNRRPRARSAPAPSAKRPRTAPRAIPPPAAAAAEAGPINVVNDDGRLVALVGHAMNEIKNADLEQSAAAMPGAGDDRTASSGTRKARDRERKRQQARNGQKAWDAARDNIVKIAMLTQAPPVGARCRCCQGRADLPGSVVCRECAIPGRAYLCAQCNVMLHGERGSLRRHDVRRWSGEAYEQLPPVPDGHRPTGEDDESRLGTLARGRPLHVRGHTRRLLISCHRADLAFGAAVQPGEVPRHRLRNVSSGP